MDRSSLRHRPLSSVALSVIICLAVAYPTASSGLSAQQAVPLMPAPPPATPLALKGVTVVDVADGRHLPAQTVMVVGNRIHAVGPAGDVRVPKGAQVVDARGKYLIPGLWDMHAHVDRDVAMYPRFIAHGVTGVREMAQRFENGTDSFRVWQWEVMEGKRVGPRSYGPSADLTNGNDITINTPEDARRVIDSLKVAGMVFLKYHGFTQSDLYFAIAREARRAGLPVVGHAPDNGTEAEVADSGMRSIEHFIEHRLCWPAVKSGAGIEEKCPRAVEAYIRNGTWITPTLAFYYEPRAAMGMSSAGPSFVRVMHRLGIKNFLAGSDFKSRPGFMLLRELMLFVESGLTPLEVLQTATLNPARFFEATDSLGTIAPGKLADLVLLDADPLVDIKHLLTTSAVVANGRYFDRVALDALDPTGVKLAKEFLAAPPPSSASPVTTPPAP